MNIISLLTSCKGRISRMQYFHGLLIIILLSFCSYVLELLLLNAPLSSDEMSLTLVNDLGVNAVFVYEFDFAVVTLQQWIVILPIVIMLTYFTLAVTIKRLHDLGKSGWYSALSLLPIVQTVLFLCLIWFQGEQNENIYGKQVEVTSPGIRT